MIAMLDLAEQAFARGDYLAAYDAARRAAAEHGAPVRARYLEVLAAARLGDAERALDLYRRRGLDAEQDTDCLSLGARLLKDQAFALDGAARAEKLRDAAIAYEGVAARTRDAFPAVNAASLWYLAGEIGRAHDIAAELIRGGRAATPASYYEAATLAEALLVAGEVEAAIQAAGAALRTAGSTIAARASTVTQLDRLTAALPAARAVADLLRPPAVAMFCGHIFCPDPDVEARLAREIDAAIAARDIGIGYGAPAAGADILIAERILAADGELNLVLPFCEADFIDSSIRPAGEAWLDRYERVKARAVALSYATRADHVGDPSQFAYGADVAMGLARVRAAHLRAHAVQLAVWDGKPGGIAGTGRDVRRWRESGGETIVIAAGELPRPSYPPPAPRDDHRELRGLLFTDFPGFSKLSESALPAFWADVMRAAGAVLDRHGPQVLSRNTWGDAIHAVLATASGAAELALDLQSALAAADTSRLGIVGTAQMRISLHFGPVFRGVDPVTGVHGFYGSEVSRAARVEPVTPPGSVYVSEPVAAVLALEAPERYACAFVGTVALPKGFGAFPLYALRRR